MTVKELIDILKTLEEDRIVILSEDEEGNYFKELQCVQVCFYDPDEGEISSKEFDPDLEEDGYYEYYESPLPAVVFWP